MKSLFAAALLLSAAPAGAATQSQVKRGDLEIKVSVAGTVVPDDVFRLKSAIEGRVESILTSTYAWHTAEEPLAYLVHRELAAMIDSHGTQNIDILEDRWQRVYRPTPARCHDVCFVLKNFLKPKTWVKPESVMFEAAGVLKLVGRVRPEDAHWIEDGQELVFWPVNNKKKIMTGRVSHYIRDIQGEKVVPGATFTLELSPSRYLDPGTDWEGQIIPLSKKGVLYVPTAALIRDGDNVYLPVRVSTGITTQGLTEVAAGIEEKRDIVVLDDAQLHGDARHKQEIELEGLRREARGLKGDGPSSSAPAPVKKPSRHATVIESPDYGEDPYAEP